MKEHPLVSVCITAYNREEFIQVAINSVLRQTYQNFEIIVIDDGSTDNTVLKIEKFKDSRIKLFRNDKNRGVVYSRNHYLEKATGEYIAVLDSDDIWHPEKLNLQMSFFDRNPSYIMCGAFAEIFYSDKKEKTKWKYPITDEGIRVRLLWGSAFVHSSLIFKRKIIKDNNIRYRKESAEDYNFIREMAKFGKVCNLDTFLVKYRWHGDQLTINENSVQKTSALAIANLYLKNIGIELTAHHKVLYSKLFNYEYSFSFNDLNEINLMFLEIIQNSSLSSELGQKYLREDLSRKWFLICYNSSHNGLKVVNFYFKNKKFVITRFLTFKHFKFFIKCLLKIKK